MPSIQVLVSDEEKAAIDEYCHRVGMSLTEHMRRGSRLYRQLVPDREITLKADMSQEHWDLIKWRVSAALRKEQGE